MTSTATFPEDHLPPDHFPRETDVVWVTQAQYDYFQANLTNPPPMRVYAAIPLQAADPSYVRIVARRDPRPWVNPTPWKRRR